MPLEKWQEDILKKGELYCVGGAVRDRLIGLESTTPDTDYLVRKIPPEELERILSAHGRVQLVGKSFGVYKFTPHETGDAKGVKKTGKNGKSDDSHATQAIDIAYPRLEASTGPGHRDFRVEFDWTLPVDADLGRRDFTINAIAQNMRDGAIIDPLHGVEDLKHKRLRMVFPAAFEEDALRILRGARFTARFDLEVDAATRRAMKSGVPHLKLLSPERIQEEFSKLLTQCKKPSTGFELLHTVGALEEVFPELDRCASVTQNEYHPDDVFVHSLKSCDCAPQDNIEVRWAALLHDLGKVDKKTTIVDKGEERVVFYGHDEEGVSIAHGVLKRLRYSNELIATVKHLIAHHMFDYTPGWSDAGVRRFMRRVGGDNLQNLFLLREADCCSRNLTGRFADVGDLKNRIDEERKKENAFKITDLAISGRDLMKEFNIKEGKIIGRVLHELLEAVLDEPSVNNKDQLIELAKKFLK